MNTNNNFTRAIAPATRIVSIDFLRGIAVLGILIMNIQSFSMIMANYGNPAAIAMPEGINKWIWIISHVLASEKFMSLFSMLFGAGLVLLYERKLNQGRHPGKVHYFRNFWLLIFGMLHAYLFWYGDILVAYALCGFFVFLFRKKQVKTLLVWAGVFYIVPILINLMSGFSIQFWPEESYQQTMQSWNPSSETIEAELAAMRGSFGEQLAFRAGKTIFFQTFLFFFYVFWRVTAMMLIGMALFKSGTLLAQKSNGFYIRMLVIGLIIALPLIIIGVILNFRNEWRMEYSMFYGNQFNYIGSLAMALVYLAIAMLISKSENFGGLKRVLSATGKMAFTNYILMTVIAGFIFYGHGLGLFGSVSRIYQVLIMLAIWAFILMLSPWWLKRFNFGPLEWLWRVLTYRNFIPFKKQGK